MFLRKKKLIERAETSPKFDAQFLKDVNEYMELRHSNGDLNMFTYKKQDGSIFNYPSLGFIGQQGMTGIWKDPFPTCCRYAVVSKAEKELVEAVVVLDEIISRIEQAKGIIPNLPKNKQPKATQVFESLKMSMNYLSVGIMTTKDMLEYINEGKGSIDANKNETAYLWKSQLVHST